MHKIVWSLLTFINITLKFDKQMMIEIWVMESFTMLCKLHSGITLSDRISLNIAVLLEHALGNSIVQVVLKSIKKWLKYKGIKYWIKLKV